MKDKVKRKCWKLWELVEGGRMRGRRETTSKATIFSFSFEIKLAFFSEACFSSHHHNKEVDGQRELCECVCRDIRKREGENMKEDKENIISWWQRAVRVEVGGCREKYGIFIKVKQIIVRTIIEFHTCCCTKCLSHPDLQCSLEWKLVVKTQNHKRGERLYGEWETGLQDISML